MVEYPIFLFKSIYDYITDVFQFIQPVVNSGEEHILQSTEQWQNIKLVQNMQKKKEGYS